MKPTKKRTRKAAAAAAAAVAAANLALLKANALERFEVIDELFTKIGKAYEKYGYRSKQYDKLQAGILTN